MEAIQSGFTAVILAAGEGTRMKSAHPKVVHEVLGQPMVCWVVDAARKAGATRIVVVVGNGADEVEALFAGSPDVECVMQSERLGTGHAVKVAIESARIFDGRVLVLCGDTPLLKASTLSSLVKAAADPSCKGGTLLTMTYDDPTGYGRVMCKNDMMAYRIIEQKDCTPEQAKWNVCNAGVYCFDAQQLHIHIGDLTCSNSQHEFYLTDMIELLYNAGTPMKPFRIPDADELMGVNSRIQLAEANKTMQKRINNQLMAQGVSMLDPDQVWVGPNVTIGKDTMLLPGTMLMGYTSIGTECLIGPQTRLTNTKVGDFCTVDETVADQATIGNYVSCGPRAYLRPGAVLMDGSKAGTHVEIKKSVIGPKSKVPHLSYIGDCTIGSNVNIGAGTITCNYNGKFKNPTTIGDNSFIGSDTMLVAPVNVGSDCTIGAGSVITKDVPNGSLSLERTEQRIVEGWLPRWARKEREPEPEVSQEQETAPAPAEENKSETMSE